MKRLLLAASAVVAASAAQAGTQTISIYDNGTLPGTATTSGDINVVSSQGYAGVTGASNGKTFGADLIQMGNGSITFHLTGLQAHSSLNLDFLLAAIDSLDGNDSFYGPDTFSVSIDLDGDGTAETSLWSYQYRNCYSTGSGVQTAPAGGVLASQANLFNTSSTDSCFLDAAYDMGVQSAFQNISHTLSDLTLTFAAANLQGTGDESYGLDALSVTLNGTRDATNVPEPAMLGLFGLGALGVALSRRRR